MVMLLPELRLAVGGEGRSDREYRVTVCLCHAATTAVIGVSLDTQITQPLAVLYLMKT